MMASYVPGTALAAPPAHAAEKAKAALSRNHQRHRCSSRLDDRPPPERATFTSLPPEIHLLITRELIYPDALSLKHTSRYFYYFVDTSINLKVEWLISRRLLHLDCPNNTRCDLGSDLRFCRGSVS